MWSSEPSKIINMLIIAAIFYVIMVVFLRISGKRSLAKMNMFDFVVTVALGSILANIALAGTPLLDGILVIALLLGLQFAISWLSVRYDAIDRILKPEPTLLFYDGEYIEKALKSERVSRRELDEQIRGNGFTGKGEVFAIVLETTGELTVIGQKEAEREDFSAMEVVVCGDVETPFSSED